MKKKLFLFIVVIILFSCKKKEEEGLINNQNNETPNTKPEFVSATPETANNIENTITLSWNFRDAENDIISYNFYLYADNILQYTQTSITDNWIKINNLLPKKQYSWQVICKDAKENIAQSPIFSFNTKDYIIFNPQISYGVFIDNRTGKQYKTIKFKYLEFFAENYDFDPAYYGQEFTQGWKKNSSEPIMGTYYNMTNGVLDFCLPETGGWRIPTKEEFQLLIDFYGENASAGKMMRETTNAHWNDDAGTNSSGFTALGGGFCPANSSEFLYSKKKALFWTQNTQGSLYWALTIEGTRAYFELRSKFDYLNVRLVRNIQ